MTQDIARGPDWSAELLISICFGQILKSTDRVLRVDSVRLCGETIEIENTSLPLHEIDKDGPYSKSLVINIGKQIYKIYSLMICRRARLSGFGKMTSVKDKVKKKPFSFFGKNVINHLVIKIFKK